METHTHPGEAIGPSADTHRPLTQGKLLPDVHAAGLFVETIVTGQKPHTQKVMALTCAEPGRFTKKLGTEPKVLFKDELLSLNHI